MAYFQVYNLVKRWIIDNFKEIIAWFLIHGVMEIFPKIPANLKVLFKDLWQ